MCPKADHILTECHFHTELKPLPCNSPGIDNRNHRGIWVCPHCCGCLVFLRDIKKKKDQKTIERDGALGVLKPD